MCVSIVILTVVAVSSAQNIRNADAIREHYSVQHPAEFERAYRGEGQRHGDSHIGSENRRQHRINENINARDRPGFEEGYHYNKPGFHHHHEHHREFHHHPRHSNDMPPPPPPPDFNNPRPPRVGFGPGELRRPTLQNSAGNQYEEANQRNSEHFKTDSRAASDQNNETEAKNRTHVEKQNEVHQTVNQNITNSSKELTKTNQSVLVQNVTNNTRNTNVTGVGANKTVTVNIGSLSTNISKNESNGTETERLLDSKRRIVHQKKHSGNNETADEKWSWGVVDDTVEVTTMPSSNVTLDDRAAFSGNLCATGMARVAGKCVEKD